MESYMVFSSLVFLYRYLAAVLLIYFISPEKLKNFVLFAFSLLFYAWGEPVYIVLMLFSTVVDYTHGLLVHRLKNKGRQGAARAVLISSVVINLGLLCFFKHSGFIVENINAVFHTSIPFSGVALPIGISFYTFQTMSYTIDVYRDVAKPQKNIIDFGTYVVLFPQLIAGPIVQYNTIAEQLNHRKTDIDGFAKGALRFTVGLGKKILLANTAGEIFDMLTASGLSNLSALGAWGAILAYTFQIYFDFSGYSDMAIGLGKVFGFDFLENFDYPYMSRSITEFWRRWHISLGSWFRDYVYIPLGGNRVGRARHIFNILTVWLLTGIWHGASWNFLFWGLYYGILLLIEKFFLLERLKKALRFVSVIYTFVIVVFGWVFFVFEKASDISAFFSAMFGFNGLWDRSSAYILLNSVVLFAIFAVAVTDIPKKLAARFTASEKLAGLNTAMCGAFIAVIFAVSTAFLVNSSYNPFLYFRF